MVELKALYFACKAVLNYFKLSVLGALTCHNVKNVMIMFCPFRQKMFTFHYAEFLLQATEMN